MPHLLRQAKVPRLPARDGQIAASTNHQARRLAPCWGINPEGEAAKGPWGQGHLGLTSCHEWDGVRHWAVGTTQLWEQGKHFTAPQVAPSLGPSQKCTPIVPSGRRRPHSLTTTWGWCGEAGHGVALWHERGPWMFLHDLENSILRFSLPFVFYPPLTTAELEAFHSSLSMQRIKTSCRSWEFQTWLKVLLIQFPSKALAFSAYLALGNKFLNIQHPFSFPWKNFKIPRSFSKPLRNPPAPSKAVCESRERRGTRTCLCCSSITPLPRWSSDTTPHWLTGKAYKNCVFGGDCLFLKQVVLGSNTACQHFQLLHPIIVAIHSRAPHLPYPAPPPPPAFIISFLCLSPHSNPLRTCCSPVFSLPIILLLLFPCTWGFLPRPRGRGLLSPVLAPRTLRVLCVSGDNEQWGIRGSWHTASTKETLAARPQQERFCSDAIRTGPAPNRLLTPEHRGARPPCQNSCKVLFCTDKTHILLQPHSQKLLNHFSWNFPKKVSLRLTPCKGYFSQNSLSLAKL